MRSYYSNSIKSFLEDNDSKILGELTRHHSHTLENLQRNAWIKQIKILKNVFKDNNEGHIFFEFAIPRMGKRVDNIIIIRDLIFVIEFKVGDSKYEKHAIDQVLDYSLDLKNFHEGSHNEKLIPILVATKAVTKQNTIQKYQDLLYETLFANENNLFDVISSCFSEKGTTYINVVEWENSIYKPTPTIIEAAQALYKGHNVQEISRSDSGAINLSRTANCINKIIDESKINSQKSICFVTGVPGAGKTLAGLNIANERMKIAEDENAVFLSGNGPLVKVLREALTRDEVKNAKINGNKITKKEAAIKANAFIQNIHHFRDEALISKNAPTEKVVIFDEAQRAWTQQQANSFMIRKKGVSDFDRSEPNFLIEVMDRHQDWCSIICLIGGGQEINTGEAGLEEWINALKDNFSNWKIYFSDLIISDNNYLDKQSYRNWLNKNGQSKSELHLSVSVRSFRSEKLSELISHLLNKNTEKARELYCDLKKVYPIVITRDYNSAKKWIKEKARGSERFGILASSNAKRLRPFGIDVKNSISASNWFLDGKNDVRSSYYMEDVATEFEIQGLELDWTI
ncbi:MAG: DNA/RNA helicase domain-containing protein, partial [Candidatus Aenigmatarchaeota archaeon]